MLELVLGCADDAALLCKAATVSTYYKELVLIRIQQHLPKLLVCAVKQAAAMTVGLQRQASGWSWFLDCANQSDKHHEKGDAELQNLSMVGQHQKRRLNAYVTFAL